MKKYLSGFLFFILLPAVFCEAKSVIVFNELVHDFGKVNKESVVRHTFTFKNNGKDKLVIDRVRTSCSCTGTLLSEREIQAGGTGKLEIELDTENNSGEMIRTINVYTNDPDNKIIKLVVKAMVVE